MDDLFGIFRLIMVIALPVFVICLIWNMMTAKKTPATEEEFDAEYERAHKIAMTCRTCGYDLRETPHRCPECGTAHVDRKEYLRRLRESWPGNPIEPRVPGPLEKLELLVNAEDEGEAALLSEHLEARGIACSVGKGKILGQFLHVAHGMKQATFQPVLVYSDDLDAAKAFLERVQGPAQREISGNE